MSLLRRNRGGWPPRGGEFVVESHMPDPEDSDPPGGSVEIDPALQISDEEIARNAKIARESFKWLIEQSETGRWEDIGLVLDHFATEEGRKEYLDMLVAIDTGQEQQPGL